MVSFSFIERNATLEYDIAADQGALLAIWHCPSCNSFLSPPVAAWSPSRGSNEREAAAIIPPSLRSPSIESRIIKRNINDIWILDSVSQSAVYPAESNNAEGEGANRARRFFSQIKKMAFAAAAEADATIAQVMFLPPLSSWVENLFHIYGHNRPCHPPISSWVENLVHMSAANHAGPWML